MLRYVIQYVDGSYEHYFSSDLQTVDITEAALYESIQQAECASKSLYGVASIEIYPAVRHKFLSGDQLSRTQAQWDKFQKSRNSL